jgi:hypothetical protein
MPWRLCTSLSCSNSLFPVGGNRNTRRKPTTFDRPLTDSFHCMDIITSTTGIEPTISEVKGACSAIAPQAQKPQETELEITADHRSMIGNKLPMIHWSAEKQGFQPEKTANHHDQELWERYFKPWGNKIKWKTGLYFHVSLATLV